MADQSVASGNHNVQALIKNSPNSHIEINERLTAQLLVPAFRRPEKLQPRTDLDLLLATSAITDFIGRSDVWNDCLAWCNASDTVSVRCMTGRSGSGKTRLALELVHHLRALPGWDARFVEFFLLEPFDLWAKTAGSNHVLLVFDQASDVVAPLADSLRRLANDPPQSASRKLRLLLLARHADWDEGWLSTLQPRSTTFASVRALFHPDQPIVLGALNEADRVVVYKQALKAAADLTGSEEPSAPEPEFFTQPRSKDAFRDPLSLIMSAVTAVRSVVPDPFALTRLELAHEVAGTLAQGMQAAFSDNPQLAHHMAAYLTLSGGMSREDAQDALAVEARANNMGVVHNPGGFIDRLRAWLPGEQTEIGAIKPDIVGEAFVLGTKAPRLRKPEDTILRALAFRREPVLSALIRLAQDFCLAEENARAEPLVWLQRVIESGLDDDSSLLRDIEAALPDSTVVLRKQAVFVTLALVRRLSKTILARPGDVPDMDLVARSAAMLNNLGNRLSTLGVREEALASAEDSVKVYRELVRIDRSASLAGLAAALGTLANARSEMGLLDPALTAAQESVSLCRELVDGNRPAWLRNLALSLTTLANRQAQLGLGGDALASAAEAVSLCREGAQRDRDAFLPDLAHSLIVLAVAQSEQELRKDAQVSAEEAVLLRRELVQRNRDAYFADLAQALVNLSTTRIDMGLHSEALAAAHESVDIYRDLAGYSPRSFLPELAHALDSLSLKQSEVGERQAALVSAKEANTIYRELVQSNHDSFLPELATSLINLGKAEGEAGNSQEAVANAQEAVAAANELVRNNRQAFLPQLALALNNLAAAQTIEGLWDEVLDNQGAAISYYRELVQESRRAHLPSLARSLVTQAGILSALGSHPLALAAAQESVDVCRELVHYSEDAYSPDLTTALVNFGRALGEVRQIPEAVRIFDEAVTRARALVRKNRNRFLPELALALNNLAAMQNALRLKEQTLESATESVSLYRELMKLFGSTYAVEYARSRNTLGVALADLERFPEAFANFGEALLELLSVNEATPLAKQVVQLLVGGYLSTNNRSGMELDQALIAAAIRFLN